MSHHRRAGVHAEKAIAVTARRLVQFQLGSRSRARRRRYVSCASWQSCKVTRNHERRPSRHRAAQALRCRSVARECVFDRPKLRVSLCNPTPKPISAGRSPDPLSTRRGDADQTSTPKALLCDRTVDHVVLLVASAAKARRTRGGPARFLDLFIALRPKTDLGRSVAFPL
jgi:hypothetical protein